MSKQEWCRLFLLSVITNGWWAFSHFPTMMTKNGETVSVLIMVPGLGTIAAFVWFLFWVFDNTTDNTTK